MKKLTVLITLALFLGFAVSPAFADVNKGQKIFIKMMKKPCGFNGGEMAKKHTQAEWEEINANGSLNEELLKQCPDAKPLNERYLPHVYDFLYNYASDSGNVPAC